MTLTVYNSLTRRLEAFTTVEPQKVKMYYCGVTVYDYCHLGHARACIVWDVVRRYLEFSGYQVRYVQNFTDVDDKILKRARIEHSSMEDVAERYIQAYFEDMARLNVKEADEYPRATQTMDGIKRLIHELENKSYAYPSNGDVYYAVQKFEQYGKLSGRKLEDMQAGASERVNVEDSEYQKKRYPFDFALWKAAKPEEPSWDSPWGKGRPGWHIECSAMVRERLGETIDIHAGGADLIFPHHENEIAQSEAVTGKPLANYWLHNGMVKVEGEKMSKSLGNFITIRELLDRGVNPMAVRLFVLTAQYRKPIDFTDEAIQAATNGWNTLKEGLVFGNKYGEKLNWDNETRTQGENTYIDRFQEAVNNDFNFSSGLSVLFELAKELGKEGNILVHQGKTEIASEELQKMWQTLVTLADVLGLQVQIESKKSTSDGLSDEQVEEKIQQRQQARITKNFAESDRIRDELQAQGITLIDSREGTKWHRS
ncbi:MAG: cysteine--tRNA ligase [Richelia sp. RM2_1_2]|nr:cysteine--tRNA ligase [Richelia sp. SM2_1_7]NJM21237.1 cysteine--tRNA ligase [Richelia sp. SM1_7_0]NJO26951.1 cysteine--tRNA ligase [Richelia sp. SL_2_1]NJO60070.1 cysteine--tRNA ligase [Richelia sp. RM2_1_2]